MPSLINKDSTKYDLTIKSGASSKSSNINPNTTIHSGIPSGKSTITLKGGNTLESDGTKDVLIEKGKLSLK